MQDAADELALEMMRKYNKEKSNCFNTLQMYRWDRLDYLKKYTKLLKRRFFYRYKK
jgi:proline dehydrogenase